MNQLAFLEKLRQKAQVERGAHQQGPVVIQEQAKDEDASAPPNVELLPEDVGPSESNITVLPSASGGASSTRYLHLPSRDTTFNNSNARALQGDVECVLFELERLSTVTDRGEIESSLTKIEKTLREVARDSDAIKGSVASKQVEDVRRSMIRADETVKGLRAKYPDISPLEIDNTTATAAINPFVDQHVSTLIAYTVALVHRVLDRAGRRPSSFVLKGFKSYGIALAGLGTPNLMQTKAVNDVFVDIRSVEKRFHLDIQTIPFAVCPTCSYTHEPSDRNQPTYPDFCDHSPFAGGPQCGAALLQNGQAIRVYEYYPFLEWMARFIALPGVARYGQKDDWEGDFFQSFKDGGGKLFVADRGTQGRWFFGLFSDYFNIETNKHGGKVSSTGVIAMFCLNLPLSIRNDPAHIYLAGIIEGPHEPDMLEAHHRHYLRPLIADLDIAFSRGVGFSSTGYRLDKVALAHGFMDFKASRPNFGLQDINAHVFCHCCGLWHKVNHLRTDCESWPEVDNGFVKEGAFAWIQAKTKTERKDVTANFGVRYSEFWKLSYWSPIKQVVVDPMHTIYLILGQRFIREGLCLDMSEKDVNAYKKGKRKKSQQAPKGGRGKAVAADDDEVDPSFVSFYFDFTPAPPLQSLRRSPSSQPDQSPSVAEDIRLCSLVWGHLTEQVSEWRQRNLDELRHVLSRDGDAAANVAFIRRNLSSYPSTDADVRSLVSSLAAKKWSALAFLCVDLMVFPPGNDVQSTTITRTIVVTDILRRDMAETLVDWRKKKVKASPFTWPHFELEIGSRPTAPWATNQGQAEESEKWVTLFAHERAARIQDLVGIMTRSAALSIGNIHQYLRQPRTSEDLTAQLLDCHLHALEYVCLDINRLPSGRVNQVTMARQLVEWRSEMPREPLVRTPIDSVEALIRLQEVVHATVVPSRYDKPPPNVGFPAAGTLKASQWRTILELYLPLALLSLWRADSPVASDKAAAMDGVLSTSMHLCCAAINMAKRNLTPQRRSAFLNELRMHIEGLKEEFPGLSFPSIHMAFHIVKYMLLFGNVRNFWCFPGERLIRMLQNIPVNHKEGETERTLLHSFARTSNFRRWLLRPNCPPLLRRCYDWLESTYRHRLVPSNQPDASEDRDDDTDREEEDQQQGQSVPKNLAKLFGAKDTLPSKFMSRLRPSDERELYSISSVPGEGNSYVCFHPEGDKDLEWVAGRIDYIFEHDAIVKMGIRRSQKVKATQFDPFRSWWTEGFQAKLVSVNYGRLEIIEVGWIVGHTARWRVTKDIEVVVNLSKD